MVVPTWSGCQVKLTRGITPLAIFDAPCTVQNVICLTRYTGVDPEVFGGIDGAVYPRPRSFILGAKLNF